MNTYEDRLSYQYRSQVLDELGVRSWINARNWSSDIGGNWIDQRVLQAMNEVSQTFVDMHELIEKADAKIAALCRVSEAHITTGAGGAIELAVAGCMAGDDFGKWNDLPDTASIGNEVILHRGHYINYTSQWKASGAKLVEYGISGTLKSSEKELKAAISERTCCIAYTFSYNNVPRGILPFHEIVEIAKEFDLPVIVDAASELPPVENLWEFIEAGADLVCFSGGKAIKAPNNTGFLLGSKKKGKQIIKSIRKYCYPNHGWNRGHKISKEQIVGLTKALEIFVVEGNGYYEKQLALAEFICGELQFIENLDVSIIKNDATSYEHAMMPHVPRVLLAWSKDNIGLGASDLDKWMAVEDPPVFLRNTYYHNYYKDVEWRLIDTYFLRSPEERIIVDRIKRFFKGI
ncbi:aminotransferase class V-fold PLP-dependent enzyme [Fulvivirgaceae bacterium BMA10]|uniref:Aminotransferase class V-fold PLP-dependent enzyme n=1 Tax=Splendidivirga corallicola TaxID=3051826 RepID=A0ABT8KXF4_9BACT|nr:aminotransferase class V-fold PLP-dependent enzyme [Fulvivirgaceae bacterium BMA10]